MKNRLKIIYKESGWSIPHISYLSGLSETKWQGALYGKTRVNSDIIEAVKKLWPQYLYWLVSGDTCPECGQISPQDEKLRLAREALDRDARKRNKKD